MDGYISDRAYVRRSLITPAMYRRIKKELTYVEYRRDAVKSTQAYREADLGSAKSEKVEIENFWRRGRYVSLPRQWAIDNFSRITLEDKTSSPHEHFLTTLKPIKPRDSEQEAFYTNLIRQGSKQGPVHILANASTGAGKTSASMYLGQQLGVRTLIIVDSNKIANGFLKDFDKFYGKGFSKKYVGRIQQDVCDYKKPYVIAMVQSLASRHYPKAMYKSFGLVCYDEVQIYGNLAYHRVLGMFNARVLAGFTATNRAGDFGRVITGYIGKPSVVSTQDVMSPEVNVVTYRLPRLVSVYSDGALINDLVRIKDRNELIADIAYQKGWKRNRVCLVFSDRVAQLQVIQKRLVKLGVPEEQVGLHVGEYEDGTYTVGYSYDDGIRWRKLKASLTSHLANELFEELTNAIPESKVWDRPYIPASVKNFVKKNSKFGIQFQVMRNTVKPSESELDSIANFCQIILVTYRIFGKGVNYPRIDMGVEGTPIGGVTQPLGRVTRLMPGKPVPEWWSVYDRFILEGTKAERFGKVDKQDEDQAAAINAFFDSKHESRKKGYAKAKALSVSYHKSDAIRGSK